jgi:hypothetical protein
VAMRVLDATCLSWNSLGDCAAISFRLLKAVSCPVTATRHIMDPVFHLLENIVRPLHHTLSRQGVKDTRNKPSG